jgi:hydrogenase/urease accessory protein HupE
MIYDLLFYFELGLFHVLDLSAHDHLLFLIALSIPFSFKQFKTMFWIVTFFTLGHSFSLFISAYGIYKPTEKIIEILIPTTIVFTGMNNILKTNKTNSSNLTVIIISVFFGLIHGFGFGNYFNQISFPLESKINPLIGFAIGVETSQLIIVLGILVINWLVIKFGSYNLSNYINTISAIIVGFALNMILNLL